MAKQRLDLSRWHGHIIGHFQLWWKIANKSLTLYLENVGNNECIGTIVRHQIRNLLISANEEKHPPINQDSWWLEQVVCNIPGELQNHITWYIKIFADFTDYVNHGQHFKYLYYAKYI